MQQEGRKCWLRKSFRRMARMLWNIKQMAKNDLPKKSRSLESANIERTRLLLLRKWRQEATFVCSVTCTVVGVIFRCWKEHDNYKRKKFIWEPEKTVTRIKNLHRNEHHALPEFPLCQINLYDMTVLTQFVICCSHTAFTCLHYIDLHKHRFVVQILAAFEFQPVMHVSQTSRTSRAPAQTYG